MPQEKSLREKNELRQAHIDALAAELGIDVVQRRFMPGMMFVEFDPPKIEGPTIFAQSEYYTMLHEIGHVVHDHTQGRPPFESKTYYFDNGVLRSEAEAWEWAMDNAALDEVLQNDTRRFMWDRCMGSYYAGSVAAGGRGGQKLWNGDRGYVKFTYDEADSYFWSIKARMLGIDVAEAARQSGVTEYAEV